MISKKNPNQPTLENRYSTFNVGASLNKSVKVYQKVRFIRFKKRVRFTTPYSLGDLTERYIFQKVVTLSKQTWTLGYLWLII